MKAFGLSLLAAALLASAPCSADERLAGGSLFTASHGQPFCGVKSQLEALLQAQISHAPYGFGPEEFPGLFPSCTYIDDNTVVAVLQDLAPGTRYNHVVRAHTNTIFGGLDGYTFSAGLSPYQNVQSHKLPHIFE